MPTLTESSPLLDALHWRYATKVFDPSRRIPEADWQALEQSFVLTPSSFGLQPYRFLVVENPELRAQLREVSWGQAQVTDASHFVVFLGKDGMGASDIDAYLARIAEVRNLPVESLAGYRNLMLGNLVQVQDRPVAVPEWAARQAYIAFGQAMLSAALLGIDACPLEGLDPKAYDRILGLEGTGFHTLAACPFGYRAEGDKYASLPKVRFPEETLIWRR